MPAKITNQMKADCIGEFSVKVEKQCNRCVYLEDTPCQCRDSEDGIFTDSYEIPWDTCKQIYKRMASHEPILNDNFQTALAALIEHHGKNSINTFCAVMKHFDINSEALRRGIFTANDIKPEK